MTIAATSGAANLLSAFTGEFVDSATERAFRRGQSPEKRKASRALFGIAAIICLLFAFGGSYLSKEVPDSVIAARLGACGISIGAYLLVHRMRDKWIEPSLVLWQIAIAASAAVVVGTRQETALVSLYLLPAIFYLAVPTSFRTTLVIGLATSALLFALYVDFEFVSLNDARLGFGLAVLNLLLAFLKSRSERSVRGQWSSTRIAQKAADDLAASQNLLQRTFDAVPIPIVVTAVEEGTILMVNRSAETFFKVTDGSLLGRGAMEFYAAPEDRATFAGLLRANGSVRNFKTSIRTSDGELRSVLLAASSVDAAGDLRRQAMVSSVLDITDLKERERQLQNAESEYRALFENSVVGVYRSTPAGKMLRANPALVKLNGYDTEDELLSAINDIASEWYVNPNRRAEWMRLMREDGRVTDFVSEVYRHKTREKVWISENGWTRFDGNGEPLYYEGTLIEATARKQSEQRIERQALFDPLTNIPNRRKLLEELDVALASYRSDGTPFTVFCLDLDRLKPVNDTFGHEAGDMILQETARRLQDKCRKVDTVARVGGDEFTILVAGIREPEELAIIAGRIMEAFAAAFDLDGARALVGASIGIAIAPVDGTDAASLMKKADLALYRAKNGGRNSFRFANDSINALFGGRPADDAKQSATDQDVTRERRSAR